MGLGNVEVDVGREEGRVVEREEGREEGREVGKEEVREEVDVGNEKPFCRPPPSLIPEKIPCPAVGCSERGRARRACLNLQPGIV